MIIPSKFNGFHGGVRRCFGGGGGGGGGDGPGGDAGGGPNDVYTPSTNTNVTNTGVNTNRGNVTGMNFTGGNTGGYGGPGINTTQGMATLGAAKGTPWGQSGAYYNDLLNQGFSSDQIRNSASSMYGAPSDANWGAMVQNAGMTSPTGRPMAGSDQFFQPVYNTSYMNYARPATQFDTSTYGTQPVYSPARAWNDRNSGSAAGGQQVVNNAIGNYFQQNPNSDINSTLAAMRGSGINRTDIQSWGGVNNYGPQMSMPSMQSPFNPYSNSSGYGNTNYYGGPGGGMLTPYSGKTPDYATGGDYTGGKGFGPGAMPPGDGDVSGTMENMPKISFGGGMPPGGQSLGGMPPMGGMSVGSQYQKYAGNPQVLPDGSINPDPAVHNRAAILAGLDDSGMGGGMRGMGGFMPQMQSPFSFQQQYNPYQMQTPFSYQPSYGGYNNYGGDFGGGFNMYTPVTQQPTQPIAPRSSGPSQAIVGRSSQMRGTPNVMRRAEGGIASLMDDVE